MAIELLNIYNKIDKWEYTPGELVEPFLVRPGVRFSLKPKHPEYKSNLVCEGRIHITTEDTTFILYTEIETIVQFDHEKPMPTIDDLYECFVFAGRQWEIEIFRGLQKEGLNKYPQMVFETKEKLQYELKGAIEDAYPLN